MTASLKPPDCWSDDIIMGYKVIPTSLEVVFKLSANLNDKTHLLWFQFMLNLDSTACVYFVWAGRTDCPLVKAHALSTLGNRSQYPHQGHRFIRLAGDLEMPIPTIIHSPRGAAEAQPEAPVFVYV